MKVAHILIKAMIKRKVVKWTRKTIRKLGVEYLLHKNYDLSAQMFSYALRDVGHGNFYIQYRKIKKLLKQKIKKSKAYNEYCSELIKYNQNKKTKKNFKPEVIEFKNNKDPDLFYSAQHVRVEYDVKKVNKKFSLELKISDTYDFIVKEKNRTTFIKSIGMSIQLIPKRETIGNSPII